MRSIIATASMLTALVGCLSDVDESPLATDVVTNDLDLEAISRANGAINRELESLRARGIVLGKATRDLELGSRPGPYFRQQYANGAIFAAAGSDVAFALWGDFYGYVEANGGVVRNGLPTQDETRWPGRVDGGVYMHLEHISLTWSPEHRVIPIEQGPIWYRLFGNPHVDLASVGMPIDRITHDSVFGTYRDWFLPTERAFLVQREGSDTAFLMWSQAYQDWVRGPDNDVFGGDWAWFGPDPTYMSGPSWAMGTPTSDPYDAGVVHFGFADEPMSPGFEFQTFDNARMYRSTSSGQTRAVLPFMNRIWSRAKRCLGRPTGHVTPYPGGGLSIYAQQFANGTIHRTLNGRDFLITYEATAPCQTGDFRAYREITYLP